MSSVVVSCRLNYPLASEILVPRPGIKPASPALEGKFFTTVPPGKSLSCSFVFNFSKGMWDFFAFQILIRVHHILFTNLKWTLCLRRIYRNKCFKEKYFLRHGNCRMKLSRVAYILPHFCEGDGSLFIINVDRNTEMTHPCFLLHILLSPWAAAEGSVPGNLGSLTPRHWNISGIHPPVSSYRRWI